MEKHAVDILKGPRITEKGAYTAENGAYVFNVAMNATKHDIMKAINTIYKVMPRKVTVTRIPRKVTQTRNTNRKGSTRAGKKAYVFLKKGETIDIA